MVSCINHSFHVCLIKNVFINIFLYLISNMPVMRPNAHPKRHHPTSLSNANSKQQRRTIQLTITSKNSMNNCSERKLSFSTKFQVSYYNSVHCIQLQSFQSLKMTIFFMLIPSTSLVISITPTPSKIRHVLML